MCVTFSYLAGQQILAGRDHAARDGGAVRACDHAVGGHVAVQPGEHLLEARGRAPVAHQVADDGEEGDDVYAGAEELVVGDVADLWTLEGRGLVIVRLTVCGGVYGGV